MSAAPRAWLLPIVLSAAVLAGCMTPSAVTPNADADLPVALPGLLNVTVLNVMNFTQSVVSPAVGLGTDLYEPTMEVSDTGTIYVAGHTVLAATTGTPAYYSNDDGKTWEPLPFLGPLQTPPPGQGSQPPPGDEGFIVAGENGQAWMADIYLAGFSVSGWCGDGAELCYDNRQAYDRLATLTAPCGAQASLNDRPWAAYGGGKLLLVNNPGGGPMQIGVMDVPPATPVGLHGGTASLSGPSWNLCASEGGWIPGIPAMRPDGFFAVPQMSDIELGDENVLTVTIGNAADVFAVENVPVFPVTSVGGGDSNGGRTAFDAKGTLFVGAKNNTRGEEVTQTHPLFGDSTFHLPGEGRFILAASTDEGKTFKSATFSSVDGRPMNSLYLDGNHLVEGALLVWSQDGEGDNLADWYVAHVHVGADGTPEIRNVTLVVDEGPSDAAHVIGAALGPDGRAYFLNFDGPPMPDYVGSTPMSVWVQQDGPALPVVAPAPAEE